MNRLGCPPPKTGNAQLDIGKYIGKSAGQVAVDTAAAKKAVARELAMAEDQAIVEAIALAEGARANSSCKSVGAGVIPAESNDAWPKEHDDSLIFVGNNSGADFAGGVSAEAAVTEGGLSDEATEASDNVIGKMSFAEAQSSLFGSFDEQPPKSRSMNSCFIGCWIL